MIIKSKHQDSMSALANPSNILLPIAILFVDVYNIVLVNICKWLYNYFFLNTKCIYFIFYIFGNERMTVPQQWGGGNNEQFTLTLLLIKCPTQRECRLQFNSQNKWHSKLEMTKNKNTKYLRNLLQISTHFSSVSNNWHQEQLNP